MLGAAVAAILESAPLTPEKVSFAWRTAVGPAIDKVSTVELCDGVLQVTVKDARWQREIEHSAPLIRSRLDSILGDKVVRYIKVAAA